MRKLSGGKPTGFKRCGGRLKVIAYIEEPELIERILAHRGEQGGEETLTVALTQLSIEQRPRDGRQSGLKPA